MNWEIWRRGIVREPPVDFQISLSGSPRDYKASNWCFSHCLTHQESVRYLQEYLAWHKVLQQLEHNKKIVDFCASLSWNLTAPNLEQMAQNVVSSVNSLQLDMEICLLEQLFVMLIEQGVLPLTCGTRIRELVVAQRSVLQRLSEFYLQLDSLQYMSQQYRSICCNNLLLLDWASQLGVIQLTQGDQVLRDILNQQRLLDLCSELSQEFLVLFQGLNNSLTLDFMNFVKPHVEQKHYEQSIVEYNPQLQNEFWTCCSCLINLATLVRLLRLYTNASRQYRNTKMVRAKLQKFALNYAEHTTNFLLLLRYQLLHSC